MLKLAIKIFSLSLIVFTITIFFIGLNKSTIYDTKNLVGQELNQISLDNFKGNGVITEKYLKKNKFTLINFWASWCAPCLKEHPLLIKLNSEKNIVLLGVNYKDNINNATKFLNEHGNPYDLIAKDDLGKQSVVFGIYGIPESILVNKDLVIIKKFIGPITKADFNEIKKTIKNL